MAIRPKTLVLAVGVPLGMLALMELAARLVLPFPTLYGVRVSEEGPDRKISVFSRYSSVQTEALVRPPGAALRLAFFGASTTVGVPYAPACSYPDMVAERLRAMLPDRGVEAVNLGASTRSARVTRELAGLVDAVDVAIIEAGHNEYLPHNLPEGSFAAFGLRRRAEASVAFRFLTRWLDDDQAPAADPSLAQTVFNGAALHESDPAPREIVESWLADDLRAAIRIQRERGAEVLVVLPPADWIDYGPEESRIGKGVDRAAVLAALVEIDAGLETLETPFGGTGEAGAELRAGLHQRLEELLAGSPELAAAQHRRAVLLRWEGDHELARVWLERAFDHAVRPHVVTPRTYGVLRRVAEEEGAVVIDAAARFVAASADGIVGFPLIVDHCHPSLEGQHLLASAVIDGLHSLPSLRDDPAWRPDLDPDLNQTLMRLKVARELRFTAALHAGTADLRFALTSFSPRPYARRAVSRLTDAMPHRFLNSPRDALSGGEGSTLVALGVAQLLSGDSPSGRMSIERGLARGGDSARALLESLRASGSRVRDALAGSEPAGK